MGAAIAVASALTFAATLREGQPWGDDFAMYIAHARNLAEGRPYADTGFVPNPLHSYSPSAYPPGAPLLLAPVVALRGLDLEALKLPGIVCWGVLLLLLHALWRRVEDHRVALAALCVLAVHPSFWDYKDIVASELPFMCLLTASWLAWERGGRWRGAHAGAWLAAAIATRSIGFLALPFFALDEWVRTRRTPWQGLAAAVGGGAAMVALHVTMPSQAEYVQQFGIDPAFILRETSRYFTQDLVTVQWRTQYLPYGLGAVPGVMAVGLAVAGFAARVKGLRLYEGFAAAYVAFVTVWPHSAPVRFLLPVLPWFCLWMVRGAVELARWSSAAHQARWAVAAALALGLGQAGLGYASRPWSDDWLLADGVTSADARRAFETVRRHVAADERFAVSRARAFALFTGRRTTIFPFLDGTMPLAARHRLLTTWASRSGVRILAIGVRTNGYDLEEFQYQLRDLVAAYPQHYEPLVADESFGLYHIR